jgi:hypothetical protein
VHTDQFTNPTRGSSAASVAAFTAPTSPRTNTVHVTRADVLLPEQLHVRCFDHCVGRFNRADESLGLKPCLMLQGAFLHPHFEILEVKKHPNGHLKLPPLRPKNQESHPRKIKNNLTPFRSGVIVRPQDLRPALRWPVSRLVVQMSSGFTVPGAHGLGSGAVN